MDSTGTDRDRATHGWAVGDAPRSRRMEATQVRSGPVLAPMWPGRRRLRLLCWDERKNSTRSLRMSQTIPTIARANCTMRPSCQRRQALAGVGHRSAHGANDCGAHPRGPGVLQARAFRAKVMLISLRVLDTLDRIPPINFRLPIWCCSNADR